MRKIIKIISCLAIIIGTFTIDILAEDLYNIEEELINLGINEEYSENIVEYLENIKISESDLEEIKYNINAIIETSKSNEEDTNVFKYYTVYDNVIDIAEILNLDLDVNISDLSFSITDKNTDNILYEGDSKSVMNLYSNYKERDFNVNIQDILQAIKIDEDDDIVINTEDNTSLLKNKFNSETDIKLDINYDINTSDKKEIDIALNKYIDELKKDNEEIIINNDYINDFKIIIFGFGALISTFTIFRIKRYN